jgi:DNA primase
MIIKTKVIPNTTFLVDEIKKRFSIEDAFAQYGRLNLAYKRQFKGKSYNIKCPFHSDRSPSFSIWPMTNTWKCWAGCGNGDVINLVSKFLSISNNKAILLLQKQLGITNKISATEYYELQDDRKILRGFNETKNQITSELLHFKSIFNQAINQVVSFEDIERIYEVYHLKPLMDKYLEDLDSKTLEIQVNTVKNLRPFLKYLKPLLDEVI